MHQDLKTSVVSLHDKNDNIRGTGFLASPRYILTCAHVVQDIVDTKYVALLS